LLQNPMDFGQITWNDDYRTDGLVSSIVKVVEWNESEGDSTSGQCRISYFEQPTSGWPPKNPANRMVNHGSLRVISGSPSRTRTYNLVVNSHPLCLLSYRG
jgi:hypothetical protein